MLAKRFFYVSAGLFLLTMTYHLGARSATAQAGATGFAMAASVGAGGQIMVMTPSGDVFVRAYDLNGNMANSPLIPIGNYWGGATAGTPTTWGKVKADYRK